MAKAGEKLIAAMQEAVSVAKGEEPAAVLHWHGHEYVPKASLSAIRASALEEAAKEVEAFEPLGPPDAEYERKDPLDYERAMSVYARTANIASAIRSLIPRPADGGENG